ncbi:hypothetical protein FQV37_1754 [Psychrobacter nivimaris]|uniref:Uncharacterized protein n=1 Tax=Psychrobacter nivimaris TaxID=281738 RepID=A0A6N7BXU8_9GAMM|nr:hypothetical protein FQV37_1754 [Psychrobacter nivimaris]
MLFYSLAAKYSELIESYRELSRAIESYRTLSALAGQFILLSIIYPALF